MFLVITEIYESCSTFVFRLNLLVVQKYTIPAVKRIYWCLLKGVVSDVPSSTSIYFHWSSRKRFERTAVWVSIQGGKSFMKLGWYRTSQAFLALIS